MSFVSCLVNRISCGVLLAVIVGCSASAMAQEVLIDWATKELVASPPEVTFPSTGKVVVRNVNNILYKYSMTITETPRLIDDFSPIANALTRDEIVKLEDSGCELGELDVKLKEIAEISGISPDCSTSIPLLTTIIAWENEVLPKIAEGEDVVKNLSDQCKKEVPEEWKKMLDFKEDFQKAVNSPHTISETINLKPDTDYRIEVHERCEGKVVVSKTWEVKPGSGVLSLSAGAMASWIEDRSYVRRSVPGVEASVLGVDGASVSPAGVALLNFQLPLDKLDWDVGGISFSTGPVFDLGSSKDTSTLGYFTGLSLQLWDRVFLTPGLHFGEFADLPRGFAPGTEIPSDFGELQSPSRWTARFGFAVTVRTVDIAKLWKKPQVKEEEKKKAGTN